MCLISFKIHDFRISSLIWTLDTVLTEHLAETLLSILRISQGLIFFFLSLSRRVGLDVKSEKFGLDTVDIAFVN